jgi:hypothetical protein
LSNMVSVSEIRGICYRDSRCYPAPVLPVSVHGALCFKVFHPISTMLNILYISIVMTHIGHSKYTPYIPTLITHIMLLTNRSSHAGQTDRRNNDNDDDHHFSEIGAPHLMVNGPVIILSQQLNRIVSRFRNYLMNDRSPDLWCVTKNMDSFYDGIAWFCLLFFTKRSLKHCMCMTACTITTCYFYGHSYTQ